MRRVLALVLGLVALLALVAPDASAQAPTSKVTINGLVDNISSYTRNMSNVDLNYGDKRDNEWYARTRVRPDITGEVGTTKFVLGLEIDAAWGQTGSADSTVSGGAPQRAGSTGGWDFNTDLLGTIELKWAYTEFDFPGMPFSSRVRLGAQPWGTAATYKLAILANGDFAGVHVNLKPIPQVGILLTWGQAEEASTGRQDGFVRGEDHAFIASLEFTPVKGIDIKPVWAWWHAEGTTTGAARQARGGLGTGAGVYPNNATEDRHTVGLDARVRLGPISIDPTVMFQWGQRDIVSPLTGSLEEQKRRAWLADLRAGFQAGPLLLEAAGIYTTGNAANSDVRNGSTKVRYYEPISTDTSYYATWAEHWALGIDYFNIIHSAAGGLNPGVAIGYDKYGLIRLGTRASYAVTPAFTVRAAFTANWTEEKVDTSGIKSAAAGLTPGDFRGDERFLGTELDLGFQWRFAPGITFDMVGAYTWAGDALNAARAVNANTGESRVHGDSKNITTATARLRFNF